MGFERAISESGMYFVSGAHVSLDEGREHPMLQKAARAYFQRKLKGYAYFFGVDVLSYAILPDHFYLLIQVRKSEDLSDDALIQRLSGIYKPNRVDLERNLLENARAAGDNAQAERLRQQFLRRMWDLSIFMKELQLHFTKWYNRKYGRRGEFWESRFRSSVVEDAQYELGLVASYIELAAVREKLVEHPYEYPYSSVAAARDGDGGAREGIARVLGFQKLSWKKLAERYLYWLYLHCGNEARGTSRFTKRYAHRIFTALRDARPEKNEWKVVAKVMIGETDDALRKALAMFASAEWGDARNADRFALFRNTMQDEESVSALTLKECNFRKCYGKEELEMEIF